MLHSLFPFLLSLNCCFNQFFTPQNTREADHACVSPDLILTLSNIFIPEGTVVGARANVDSQVSHNSDTTRDVYLQFAVRVKIGKRCVHLGQGAHGAPWSRCVSYKCYICLAVPTSMTIPGMGGWG